MKKNGKYFQWEVEYAIDQNIVFKHFSYQTKTGKIKNILKDNYGYAVLVSYNDKRFNDQTVLDINILNIPVIDNSLRIKQIYKLLDI